MTKRRPLNGDHNQCPTCGEYFNSTFAFDKHRIGAFVVDRRCRTVAEMQEAGMALNAGNWWISEKGPEGLFHPDSVAVARSDENSAP